MMDDSPKRRPELNGIDILVLLWLILLVLTWISPAIEDFTGKAKTIATEFILLIAVLSYLYFRKLPIIELCRWRLVPLAALPYMILFGISGAFLLDGLDRLVGLVMPFPAESLDSLRQNLSGETNTQKFLVLLGVGFGAPLVEETIFRGAIQKTFERRSNVTTAVMTTALIFSLIHFQFAWLIQLLIMSVFLGWLSWRWDSIIPAVILHSGNNILSYFLMIEMNQNLEDIYLSHGQLHPLIAIVALAIAYISLKRMVKIGNNID